VAHVLGTYLTLCNLQSATSGWCRPLRSCRVVASQKDFDDRPLALMRWLGYEAAKSACHRMELHHLWLCSGVKLCARSMIGSGLASSSVGAFRADFKSVEAYYALCE
jgi:hypothetical protein